MVDEVILYDFCGTLVDFQTANAYIEFAVNKLCLKRSVIEYIRILLCKMRLMPIINKLHPNMSVNKALLLYRLRGYHYDILDSIAKEFYNEYIKPHLINPVVQKLISDIKDGKNVVIISGGYDIYLKYFIQEYKVPYLISTQLQFKDNIFTGKIIGHDCMGKEKIIRLYQKFPLIKYAKNKFQLTLYSDSESDIPLFSECDNRIVVVEKNNNPEWIKNYDAEILYFCKSN